MLYCLFFALTFGNVDYAQIFGEDYQQAVEWLVQHHTAFETKAVEYDLSAHELESIVFPELIRYSQFSDFFETKALELAYIQGGKDVADFSIGHFQMKPSFVELLEQEAQKQPSFIKQSFVKITSYPEITIKEKRALRLKRLQSIDWQLDYLCCFYKLVQGKFLGELAAKSEEEQIKFLATAYNCGFTRSFETIERYGKRALYPYGTRYPAAEQYVYADVAVDYFKKK